MTDHSKKLIIESVREDGSKLRPSDWIERLSANMAEFGKDHRLHYSNKVRPKVIDGEKCLCIDSRLQSENPEAFEFILGFARSNQLRTREA
ncbi:MAG: DUF3579 domain-containing protein [Gammaproteobacteria bacterium]|nr:DUF3579 domain-containing protein [Gammaproteobacteria bacterium]